MAVFLYGCIPEKPKVYRVGVLAGFSPFTSVADGFVTGLEKLGYIEGENILYDLQKVNVDPAAYRRVLDTFVDEKVALIFTFPTAATVAAKQALHGIEIPVVTPEAYLRINYKLAQKWGLTVPEDLLHLAKEIIR